MPGHVKLGKSGEPDPDPAPYLIVSLEMKREDSLRPYDARKSYWCPDGNGGFKECMLQDGDVETPGSKCTVMIGHEVTMTKRVLQLIPQQKILLALQALEMCVEEFAETGLRFF